MRGSRFLIAAALATVVAIPALAHAPSGAIFTTLPDGSEVNFNIYASKDDVYLDGGPGIGSPQTAAGLDDGTYVFQVTDPSGKKLLSTDAAKCRQFTVAAGVISDVVATGCEHVTGFDVDHDATTVQLMPYLDTPNPGGEYKAWVVRVDDFLAGCSALGEDSGLDVVDCGQVAGNFHGFVPAHTKTDNYKVKDVHNLEIDTHFYDAATGAPLDGLGLIWIDTLGASNRKFSYTKPELSIDHIAHVEAVEKGVHRIVIENQPGCTVTRVFCGTSGCAHETAGPSTVEVTIRAKDKIWTKDIKVWCQTTP